MDYYALSFVKDAQVVKELKDYLQGNFSTLVVNQFQARNVLVSIPSKSHSSSLAAAHKLDEVLVLVIPYASRIEVFHQFWY